jgi:hypothetical protein
MTIRPCRSNRLSASWLIGLLAVVLGGCVTGISSSVSNVVFAPDGKRVAFVKDDFAGLGHMLILASISWNNAVFWADTSSPQKLKRFPVSAGTELAALGRSTGNNHEESARELRFSPDGSYLAIETGARVIVLDAANGEVVRTVNIDSSWRAWAWYSPDQLTWCRATDRPHNSSDVRIVRQKVAQLGSPNLPRRPPGEPAEELARWAYPDTCIDAHWSPSGRYVVIASLASPGPARLFDLRTGQVHEVSSGNSIVHGVSWRADESAVLVSLELTRPELFLTLLLKIAVPEAGMGWSRVGNLMVTIELSGGKTDAWEVGDKSIIYMPSTAWTADNRFVPSQSNGSEAGAVLIEPAGRQILDLTERIYSRTGLKRGCEFAELYAMPVSGWLCTWDKKGQAYAVDYSATTFVPLSKQSWAVSVDGKLLAEVSNSGRLTVRPLTLPAVAASQAAPALADPSRDARIRPTP